MITVLSYYYLWIAKNELTNGDSYSDWLDDFSTDVSFDPYTKERLAQQGGPFRLSKDGVFQ